jgi:hypothetical protein
MLNHLKIKDKWTFLSKEKETNYYQWESKSSNINKRSQNNFCVVKTENKIHCIIFDAMGLKGICKKGQIKQGSKTREKRLYKI